MNSHKQEFFSLIERLFIGSSLKKLENTPDGGFSNLLAIKSKYFKQIKIKIEEQFASLGSDKSSKDNQEELCNKLVTFLESFISPETGSMYFNNTPFFKNIYYKVNKTEDVYLFYKTKDLFYVKSDITYGDLTFEDDNFIVHFSTKDLENKKGNEKNGLLFAFLKYEKKEDKTEITIEVRQKSPANKELLKETIIPLVDEGFKNLLKTHCQWEKKSTKEQEDIYINALRKIFDDYLRQSSIDYFIHKNPEIFLKEQYKMFFYEYVFNEGAINQWTAERLKTLQQFYDIGMTIIEDITELEKQCNAMWLKPKFPFNVNYIISLETIAQKDQKILKYLLIDQKYKTSFIKEWKDLGLIEESFQIENIFNKNPDEMDLLEEKTTSVLNNQYKHLALDTKHLGLSDKIKLLSLFDNLTNQITGTAIKGDNYQALNTLKLQYKEKVKCIYIDPPYNTKNKEFVYMDGFKHSTWLTMMRNRLELAKEYLTDDGVIFISIDDNEQANLKLLCDEVFGEENFVAQLIWEQGKKNISSSIAINHEYVIVYSKNKSNINSMCIKKIGIDEVELLFTKLKKDKLSNIEIENRIKSFYKENPKLSNIKHFCLVDDLGIYYQGDISQGTGRGTRFDILHPITGKPCKLPQGGWRFSEESYKDFFMFRLKFGKDETSIPKIKRYLFEIDSENLGSVFYKDGRGATKKLNALFNQDIFAHSKDEDIIQYFIESSTQQNSSDIIFDFFAGSGTTAHAIMKMNAEDGGNRKFILIEQNEYFDTVILPRIKKIAYSQNYKEGKAQNKTTGQQIFVEYYGMEQYEDTLVHAHYNENHFNLETNEAGKSESTPFLSEKLLFNGLNIKDLENGKKEVFYTLQEIYKDKINILEIAKILSLIYQSNIKSIKENIITLIDKEGFLKDYDISKMYLKDYQELKPYLYWN